MPYSVSLALRHDELAAIELATMRLLEAREAIVLLPPDGTDEPPQLELEYPDDAGDVDAVRALAIARWQALQEFAGLELRDAEITGVTRFSGGEWTREHELVDDAFELEELGRYEMAVVASQAACELVFRDLLAHIAASHGTVMQTLVSGIREAALRDQLSPKVVEAHFNLKLSHQHWWNAYNAHVVLRNNIIHHGAKATRDDAHASFMACQSARTWASNLMNPPPF